MCDVDTDLCPVWRETGRKARKVHRCTGCREDIVSGHRYVETATLFEGHWSTCKHCLRCDALFKAIADKSREVSGFYVVAIDPQFACGESWIDNFGAPPPEVEALAFLLPGEPLPE